MKKRVAASDMGAMAAALHEQRDSMLENPSGNGAIPGRAIVVNFSIVKDDASNTPYKGTLDVGLQLVAFITLPEELTNLYIGGVEIVDDQGTTQQQMLQPGSTL